MPNYKEMYLTMARETEKAINILIDAQRKCEDMYINSDEPEISVISSEEKKKIIKFQGTERLSGVDA